MASGQGLEVHDSYFPLREYVGMLPPDATQNRTLSIPTKSYSSILASPQNRTLPEVLSASEETRPEFSSWTIPVQCRTSLMGSLCLPAETFSELYCSLKVFHPILLSSLFPFMGVRSSSWFERLSIASVSFLYFPWLFPSINLLHI